MKKEVIKVLLIWMTSVASGDVVLLFFIGGSSLNYLGVVIGNSLFFSIPWSIGMLGYERLMREKKVKFKVKRIIDVIVSTGLYLICVIAIEYLFTHQFSLYIFRKWAGYRITTIYLTTTLISTLFWVWFPWRELVARALNNAKRQC